MQKLIKNGQPAENSWNLLRADELTSEQSQGNWILPLILFNQLAEQNKLNCGRHSVWLASDANISDITHYTTNLKIIAVDFPAFADGRGFSIARILREQYDFSGEIRAIGHFMEDQVYYLSRCGFDAFSMEDGCNTTSMIDRLSDFSDSYQACVDEPQPLFRRRT